MLTYCFFIFFCKHVNNGKSCIGFLQGPSQKCFLGGGGSQDEIMNHTAAISRYMKMTK